ncbi:hypothetical protein PR202_ga07394 [Eleusine coracana subsp. coracana]|uniref:C2 domain-containing protein n=1 Tax=Eleusine coracana subsp. coracana TaxID=191504 RepID=A0AAV5BZU5_ELECO|nr:hypothetical protein PR202_ga07394 [Eleusine coracana subsp. coracana]
MLPGGVLIEGKGEQGRKPSDFRAFRLSTTTQTDYDPRRNPFLHHHSPADPHHRREGFIYRSIGRSRNPPENSSSGGGRGTATGEMLAHLIGLVKVRVVRGVNLAVRDLCSSDPYVIVRMGKQKLKTRVIKKSTNPEWNEELTLSIEDAAVPIRLEVYDKDTFIDDSMGHAELDIRPLVEIVKMKLQDVADNTVVKKLVPNRQNCLAEESTISISQGKVKQDIVVRLKNVECGEIELQLQWVDEVFDKDTFIDSMDNAERDIPPLQEIVKKLQDVVDNTVVKKLVPNRQLPG